MRGAAVIRALDAVCAAGWIAVVGVLADDDRRVPVLRRPGDGAIAPPGTVTVVVPARDEERDVATTLHAAAAQDHPRVQVVAVDDESRDATRARMASVPGVEVVDGMPPPPGWHGKAWACAQGVRRARGDWLLFLDADVALAPWAVRAALGFAVEHRRAGLTLFPTPVLGTVAERVALPGAGILLETTVMPDALARRPRSDVAIGVGGFLLVHRAAYERAGGHAAVRREVVEDLALARALKAQGTPLAWARGGEALRLRMYHDAGELWRGWRKNAADAWRVPAPLALAGIAMLALGVGLPWASAAARRPYGLLALGAQLAAMRRAGRNAGVGARYAATAPLAAAFFAAVALAGLADRARGRPPTWRGRTLA